MFLQWWFPIGSLYGFQSERTAQMVVPGEGDAWKKSKKKENQKRTNFGTGKIEWAAPPFDLLTGSVLTKITD